MTKQIKDAKTGKLLNIYGPFNNRTDALAYAAKLGLRKSSVKSRPAGYMIEKELK